MGWAGRGRRKTEELLNFRPPMLTLLRVWRRFPRRSVVS